MGGYFTDYCAVKKTFFKINEIQNVNIVDNIIEKKRTSEPLCRGERRKLMSHDQNTKVNSGECKKCRGQTK